MTVGVGAAGHGRPDGEDGCGARALAGEDPGDDRTCDEQRRQLHGDRREGREKVVLAADVDQDDAEEDAE